MIKRWIKNYLIDNKYEVLLFCTIVIIGITIGITTFLVSSEKTQGIGVEAVTGVLNLSVKEEFIKANIIADGIKSNLILLLILFILSITLFGKWGIYAVMFIKGVGIGIYTVVLFNVFGLWWGLLVNIMLVLFVNLIYMPALIYIGISLVNFNFDLFKIRNDGLTSKKLLRVIANLMISFVFMFSSIILEQILSTVMLNIYSKIS